jgi:hypothetical protein
MALNPDTLVDRSGRRLYAFFEQFEDFTLTSGARKMVLGDGDIRDQLWKRRTQSGLPRPTHELQLECIEADFFDAQQHLHLPILGNDAAARTRRRVQLLNIPSDFLSSVLALVAADDRLPFRLNAPPLSGWFEVHFTETDGDVPAALSADAEFEAPQVGQLRFLDEALPAATLRNLRNAFNLDFIEDAATGEEGNPLTIAPTRPNVGGDGSGVTFGQTFDSRSRDLEMKS